MTALPTVIALSFAHVLADFVLQTRVLVAGKRRPAVFALHIALVAVTCALALGARTPLGAAVVGWVTLSHAGIDAIKLRPWAEAWAARAAFGGLRLFVYDQLAHWLSLAFAAAIWPRAFSFGAWPALLGAANADWLLRGFALGGGFWLATRVGDLLLARLMVGLRASQTVDNDHDGRADAISAMPGAGAMIGWLERTLVFVFVLLGQFNAIGFVIAAKSILRFQYAREPGLGEIVIIGTLASFGWAIAMALVTRAALVLLGGH